MLPLRLDGCLGVQKLGCLEKAARWANADPRVLEDYLLSIGSPVLMAPPTLGPGEATVVTDRSAEHGTLRIRIEGGGVAICWEAVEPQNGGMIIYPVPCTQQ